MQRLVYHPAHTFEVGDPVVPFGRKFAGATAEDCAGLHMVAELVDADHYRVAEPGEYIYGLDTARTSNETYYLDDAGAWSLTPSDNNRTVLLFIADSPTSGVFVGVDQSPRDFSDATFRIHDDIDPTKKLAWQVSGISPATTRTWTVLDADIVVAGSAAVLTSTYVPRVIANGTLADSTITDNGTICVLTGDTSVANGKLFGLGATSTSAAFLVNTNPGVTGVGHRAIYINNYSFPATATSVGRGLDVALTTINSVFTMPVMTGVNVGIFTKGALATVTAADGFHSSIQTVGATSNTGFHFGNGVVAAGTWGFYSSASSDNQLGTGQTQIAGTTDSTSTTTGSLITAGGVGIAKALRVGGLIRGAADLALSQSLDGLQLGIITNTSAGTSAQAEWQANNDAGDDIHVGIWGTLRTGSQFGVSRARAAYLYTTTASVTGLVVGHTGANVPIVFGINNVEVSRWTSGTLASGSLTIAYTTDATTTATGSFITAGGIGIAKALWVGGIIQTAASTVGTAGLNLPHGVAPAAPVNGDLWTTTGGAFARVNGSTVQLDGAGGSGLTLPQVMAAHSIGF